LFFVLINTHAATAKGEGTGLLEFYERVRAYTEELCKPLEIEDYIPQPNVDVSPPKWNIAHTTWFFEEMILKRFVEGYQEFNPQFAFLFNSYYTQSASARHGTIEVIFQDQLSSACSNIGSMLTTRCDNSCQNHLR